MAHPFGEPVKVEQSDLQEPCRIDTFLGPVHVRWAPEAAVTPLGQLPFFIDYLKQADLFDPFVAQAPIRFTSPNAPDLRDLLGTLVLSIVTGGQRYAHVNALRHDGINPALLGMKKVCSDDSVRRGLSKMEVDKGIDWLHAHLLDPLRPILQEPWVLDVDSTVKPIYGQQEGAVVGYNPKKPGRPSHVYHTYAVAGPRLVLEVDVKPGNQHHGSHGLEGLEQLLDRLSAAERPTLVRGDISYGTETVMHALERRGQPWLFRIRMTRLVQQLVVKLASETGWVAAGKGAEVAEGELQLAGWSNKRRVVVIRQPAALSSRPSKPTVEQPKLLPGLELVTDARGEWDYVVLATSLDWDPLTLPQLYRDRGDAENLFDELKNQWGWGGFVTQDMKRTQITARITGIVYNWWSLFVRMIHPEAHREAITSRPQLIDSVARATRHGGQTTLTVSSSHSASGQLQSRLNGVAEFLQKLCSAPQLSAAERWCVILGRALVKYLKGKVPKPPPALVAL